MSLAKKTYLFSAVLIITGQLILFLCLTLIGRKFGPAALGDFNLNLCLGSLIGTLLALRYDLTCLNSTIEESYQSLVNSIAISALAYFILYSAALFFNNELFEKILPFSLIFIIQQTLTNYFCRNGNFIITGSAKAAANLIFFIFLNFKEITNQEEIFKAYTLINIILTVLIILPLYKRGSLKAPKMEFYKKNINFPKYTLPATLLNSSLVYSIPIFTPNLFGALTAGYIAAAHRFGSFPVSLVAQTINGIFSREASLSIKNKEILKTYKKFSKFLFLIAALYILFGLTFFNSAVQLTMGDEWQQATKIFYILAPTFSLQIIYIPLSQIFIITESQKTDFLIQLFIFIGSSSSLTIAYLTNLNATITLALFSLFTAIALLTGIRQSYKAAKDIKVK